MRRVVSFHLVAISILSLLSSPPAARAGRLGSQLGFEAAFGFDGRKPPQDFDVLFLSSSAAGNVFWPGEKAGFKFQLANKTSHALAATGKWQLVEYTMRSGMIDPLSDVRVVKLRDVASVPVTVDVPAKGFVELNVDVPLPEAFGAFAIMLSLDGEGTQVAATCVRAMKASTGKVFEPAFAIDAQRPEVAPLFRRLGIRGTRQEWGCFGMDDQKSWARLDEFMKTMADNDVTVMLTLMTNNAHMPMKCIRGLLNDKGEGKMDYPGDFVAMPEFDGEFQAWVKEVAVRYGWPKGPLNAVELWNEPWEGSSISGWGADMIRYRAIYTHMAQGVEEARKEAGVKVLIGGACSSMNTEDKLFPDGNDEPFLKWLDFTSIHYQPMCSQPALVKRFAQRQGPLGKTRVWDTETWLANSDERLLGTLASMRAQGLERTAGIMHDYVRNIEDNVTVHHPDGKTTRIITVQALAPAVAVAAADELLGQRTFKELLFKNGLPWVFVFDGLTEKGVEDGTVVVVGDLGSLYERDKLLFKGVLGLKARQRSSAARAALAALPADAPAKQVTAAVNAVRNAEVLDGGAMTLADAEGHFLCLDVEGNAVKSTGGKLIVPLDGIGYFLRTDGSAGSFARLLDALRAARIDGLEPAGIVAHDLLARIEARPTLRLTITNVLNRPIAGKISAKLGDLQLADSSRDIALAAHETKDVAFAVSGGSAAPDNTYALAATFDAGPDGRCAHEEEMHVNVIARRTIHVDGSLDDWKDVLPQPIRSQPGSGKNLTEKAWLPFKKFDDDAGQGFASGYLAFDDQNFYFAARIADATPDAGNIRFSKRDDDSYFYPEISYNLRQDPKTHKVIREEKRWPAGVPRYSYRRDPAIPSGSGTDNVQIGFNVLPIEQTDWLPYPPGTMPKFMCYKTTDYEFALNSVAEAFGGGTEIWRLLAPGMPRKHFYPRQPKAPRDGGPVDAGQLVMKRDGNTRIVECALPWSEIPDVKRCLDKGEPIKFTFRVNDNKGPSYELNGGRSVSKIDTYALHDYWATSWAVETEFVFEK